MSDLICSVPGGGSVQLLNDEYSDLTFVNAARVSFDNRSEQFTDKDIGLLKYLATHDHWTPFAHALLCFKFRDISDSDLLQFLVDNHHHQFRCVRGEYSHEWYVSGSYYAWAKCRFPYGLNRHFTEVHNYLSCVFPRSSDNLLDADDFNDLRMVYAYIEPITRKDIQEHYNINLAKLFPITMIITAPIAIRTQLFKSKIGLVENEISRRYVSYQPEIYNPRFADGFRGKPEGSAKQGSSDQIVCESDKNYDHSIEVAQSAYYKLINKGVCAEQARFILPQGAYTSWWWTGYIDSFARVYKLRSDSHAQKETQKFAQCMDTLLTRHYDLLWKEVKGA